LSAELEYSASPGKGGMPFLLSDGRLISWDDGSGDIHHRKKDGTWLLIARFLSTQLTTFPALIDGDRLALCYNDGDEVVVPVIDLDRAIAAAEQGGKPIDTEHPAWRAHRLTLEEPLLNANETAVNVTNDGRLQIMFCRRGNGAYRAVVESVEKFDPESERATDGN